MTASFEEEGRSRTSRRSAGDDDLCRCSFCFALLAAVANAERNLRRRAEERSMTVLEGGKSRRAA